MAAPANSAVLQNIYYERKVGTAKSCYICHRPTTTVLATLKTEDFLYTCEVHLSDPASPIAPPPQLSAPSAEDIRKVVADYNARESKKKEASGKPDEKEKDPKDAKSPSPAPSPAPSVPTSTPPAQPTHKKFALHGKMFEIRKQEMRRREQGVKASEVGRATKTRWNAATAVISQVNIFSTSSTTTSGFLDPRDNPRHAPKRLKNNLWYALLPKLPAGRSLTLSQSPISPSNDVSEEQLAGVFSEAGPVSNVEIKFDPQSGRSKGYAFVSFYDESTALSAVRNLQDAPVNGRNLRVELSTDEPGPRRRGPPVGAVSSGPPPPGRFGGPSAAPAPFAARGSYGGPPGGGAGGGRFGDRVDTPPPARDYGGRRGDDLDLRLVPQGVELPPGEKAVDAISKTLAAINPGQMQDVMTSMKQLVQTNPDQARVLLSQQPQLAYALFQAMLLLNIVDPSVLQSIHPLPPPTVAAPPPSNYGQPPAPYGQDAGSKYGQPPSGYGGGGGGSAGGYGYPPASQPPQAFRPPPSYAAPPAQTPPYPPYGAPPPAAHAYGSAPAPPPAAPTPMSAPPPVASGVPGMSALPPAAQAALATLPEDQQAMLIQVLSLAPEQINALDPTQRASVVQLRQQFLGTA
ncbi:hypothetical protein L198_00013 [Cryptococcus wingfieldii CBS 7118]|uniref:RRM domain-containing protein n=1 Tax=Cryptococcus wingfieldii CBS 7118 TaxID=1295528 RepID=A0A1E3K562_9TREE|nr:hypothetical protein L198_00013 [Cryptococcus wingfieldii CBS 7118]ODO08290.1 hypothetical protein L198_00013 [Cryptococcus wingfieldii CBS 7118]